MAATAVLNADLAVIAAPPAGIGQGQFLLALLAIAVFPALLAVTTAFARIVIVLFFLRAGMGSQFLPPNVVVMGLAMVLTWYVMAPTVSALSREVVAPLYQGRLAPDAALQHSQRILRAFMQPRLSSEDYLLLARARNAPADPTKGPFELVAAAFALTELRIAFLAGVLVYLPFLAIDVLIYLIIGALGTPVFSPQTFALPVKVVFFVAADGWRLVVGALSQSYLGG
ncbi:MAG: flagellar type III secretion system pore protein FliP [Armatimonadetes bacterium]|nr:flagellar type III secretion system pore protein FliP [Armatimonadota bacterium]